MRRMADQAPEAHEWPDGQDGWLGSPTAVVMSGSACEGRIDQYANFVSKQATMASYDAALAYARIATASSSPRCRDSIKVAARLSNTTSEKGAHRRACAT